MRKTIVAACHSEWRPCFSTSAACVNAFTSRGDNRRSRIFFLNSRKIRQTGAGGGEYWVLLVSLAQGGAEVYDKAER